MPVTLLTLKYRLYPTSAQESALRRMLATCCAVYNSLLHWRKHDYECFGTSPTYYEQKQALTAWKPAHPELQQVHSQVLQEVCKRVDLAFAAFFRRVEAGEKAGYPRLKGEGHYDSLTFPQTPGFAVSSQMIRLSKIGEVKAVIHRCVAGTAKTCTIRVQSGKWFACICYEVEAQALPISQEQVGIDVGLHHFAATSEGEILANPRFFRQEEKALQKAQRKIERLKSARSELQKARLRKARRVIARVQERIRNQRHNFLHQESRKLVNRFGLIAIEDLQVKNLLARPHPKQEETTGQYLPNGACRKAGLNKSLADAAWSKFRAMLTSKAERAGRLLIAVDPAYSSIECSGCGERVEKALSERIHICPNPECSLVLDRDVNAAINLLNRALEQIAVGRYSVAASTA